MTRRFVWRYRWRRCRTRSEFPLDTDKRDRLRRAISAINRRRRRRFKPGAHPRDVTRSWAEYGPVSYRLNGPGSLVGLVVYALLGLLSVFSSAIIVAAAAATGPDRELLTLSPLGWVLAWAVVAILVFAALVSVIAIATALWRIVAQGFGRL